MGKALNKYAHPDYMSHYHDYEMIRDCYDGSRAVKEAAEKYLPRLSGQLEEDYNNYRARALFFPITGKTVSTMVGLATTKPPKTSYPSEMSRYFVDTDPAVQFTEFYIKTFHEVTLMGRFGVLIDAPVDGGEEILVPYLAENIVNWDVDKEGHPNDLLLREWYLVPGDDRFEKIKACRFRHCFIKDGVYQVEILDSDLEVTTPAIVPSFRGRALDFIPFAPLGSTGVHMHVDKPPMLDISTINVSHYMSSADLEWGRHLVGLPTPVISGVDSSTKLHIGGTTAWVLPPAEAKA